MFAIEVCGEDINSIKSRRGVWYGACFESKQILSTVTLIEYLNKG